MDNKRYTRGSGVLENFLAKKRAKAADNKISENFREGKILDLGCGSFPFFLSKTKFHQKFGIDKNIDNSEDSNLILRKEDFSKDKLDFPDNYFDVATLLAVVEHFSEDDVIFILSEARRVLKNEGLLIITTPVKKSGIILRIMAKFNLVSSDEINEHKQVYTKKVLRDQLVRIGYKDENINISSFELGLNLIAVAKK